MSAVKEKPRVGGGGTLFEEKEHLVKGLHPPESEQALCGAEVPSDEPWDMGWPICEACKAVARGGMN